MIVDELLSLIKEAPEDISFEQVINIIDEHYEYTPTRFINGQGATQVINEAGSNEGSCKIFAFGLIAGLDETQTLACFGRHYREDVLKHPEGQDHMNIRSFMRYGWAGIQFDGQALASR
jgi:hypothetical protein